MPNLLALLLTLLFSLSSLARGHQFSAIDYNGELMINDGVTRSTRAAMTGNQVTVQVIENNPALNLSELPKVGAKIPGKP